jgi:hypothetical protein
MSISWSSISLAFFSSPISLNLWSSAALSAASSSCLSFFIVSNSSPTLSLSISFLSKDSSSLIRLSF